jgi:hypothetical protein
MLGLRPIEDSARGGHREITVIILQKAAIGQQSTQGGSMFRALVSVAVVLLMCGTLSATENPVDKGSVYLSGTLTLQVRSGDLWEDNDDALVTYGAGTGDMNLGETYEVSPTVGYFVAPSVFLGAQFGLIGYAQGDDNFTAVAIGPTVGYFFNLDPMRADPRGAIYPYIRGYFNYGSTSNGSDLTMWQYGGRGGLLYMISNTVATDVGLRFQGDSWKRDGDSESTTGTTLAFSVGITAFIY